MNSVTASVAGLDQVARHNLGVTGPTRPEPVTRPLAPPRPRRPKVQVADGVPRAGQEAERA